ncbi:cell division protein FtsZ, partial [Sphingobacteriales bacterium CHB3]|nr:cell division protein FtsZ [Sphingobacteriales bacterium CHB3]
VMGTGVASGENRATVAAHEAISSPLLEDVTIGGAQGVLVNITGGPNMSLSEIEEATEIIHGAAGEDVNVILGAVVDEKMTDDIMVTVIATGFNRRPSVTVGTGIRPGLKTPKTVERIPTGVTELKNYDTPAFARRGVDLQVAYRPAQDSTREDREKIDKNDPEKPAFLRRIMD